MNNGNDQYLFSYSDNVKKTLSRLKKKDNILFNRTKKKINEIIDNPFLGKPLRNIMKNRRRVQIGSFVLVYKINENESKIRFLDFDHHDKVYKKK